MTTAGLATLFISAKTAEHHVTLIAANSAPSQRELERALEDVDLTTTR
ncbi:hypothetical protein [Lentzea flaviverrucosa]|nr:hypothetical protein [Lentzea flaviverrucosa]